MNMAHCTSAFKRIIALIFAILTCCLGSPSVSPTIAAENPAGAAFKDPYNSGIKLPNGGGEPGNAYTVFINAAYSKDHTQICRLMADPSEVPQCLQQKEALNGYIAMLTQPKTHKVLGGFMKADEATLDVAYAFASGPPSSGFVVMKKMNGRWVISSFGGSGSATITAEASGKVDLATGAGAASAARQFPEAKYTGPALGKWTFEGKDSKGVAWTGTLTISKQDSGGTKYIDCSLDATTKGGTSNGVGSECRWDPSNREVLFGPELNARYSAILSADGKTMTQGKWTEAEKNWNTQKVIIKKTGVWSAAYSAGQADPRPPSVPAEASAASDTEFAVIKITPNTKEYNGRCPATIAFTADITFKMPVPDKFTYQWEFSDGRKLPERTIKPPRTGHMSLREVWRGGTQGEEHQASVRFAAGAGGATMVLDPPAVKVTCK